MGFASVLIYRMRSSKCEHKCMKMPSGKRRARAFPAGVSEKSLLEPIRFWYRYAAWQFSV